MKMKSLHNSYKMKCMGLELQEEDNQIQWQDLEWEAVESQLDRRMSNNLSPL